MHLGPSKTSDQQFRLLVHRAWQGFVESRTAAINRIRGLLAESGLFFAKGPTGFEADLTDTIEDADNEMNAMARLVVRQAQTQWRELDTHIAGAMRIRRQEQPGRQIRDAGVRSLVTKQGDTYLRSLLVQGADSAVMSAHKRTDPISVSVTAPKERLGWQKAAVALANKNERILLAVMTTKAIRLMRGTSA